MFRVVAAPLTTNLSQASKHLDTVTTRQPLVRRGIVRAPPILPSRVTRRRDCLVFYRQLPPKC